MKKKLNILLTCAGGSSMIYLAREMRKTHNIFLADASKESIARFSGLPFTILPFGTNPAYTNELKKIITKWNLDCIVPGADEELLPVSKLRDDGVIRHAIVPDVEFIRTCLNKKELMKQLALHDISTLLPYQKKSQVKYPAIVKPVYGRGSRGVHTVHSASELAGYLKLYKKVFDEVLVQPYIAGVEYTVSVIVNDKNQLIGVVPKKVIEKRGITRAAIAVKNLIIERACKKIVRAMNPCGLFNAQLKLLNNRVYIFEINPRLSTTLVLTDQAFGNEVLLQIENAGKHKISPVPKMKSNITLYRYEENVFIDPRNTDSMKRRI